MPAWNMKLLVRWKFAVDMPWVRQLRKENKRRHEIQDTVYQRDAPVAGSLLYISAPHKFCATTIKAYGHVFELKHSGVSASCS